MNYAVALATSSRECSSCFGPIRLGATLWMTVDGEYLHPECVATEGARPRPVEAMSNEDLLVVLDKQIEHRVATAGHAAPLEELRRRYAELVDDHEGLAGGT